MVKFLKTYTNIRLVNNTVYRDYEQLETERVIIYCFYNNIMLPTRNIMSYLYQ